MWIDESLELCASVMSSAPRVKIEVYHACDAHHRRIFRHDACDDDEFAYNPSFGAVLT